MKKQSDNSTLNKKFAYEEPQQALNVRISAHLKYSNFNLHDWMRKHFKMNSGDRILDLGCGNGNYTALFWEHVRPSGLVVGVDKNAKLIEEAKEKHKGLPYDNVKFTVQDFDAPSFSQDGRFHWIFAVYSLYYTEDSLRILRILKNQLLPGGTFTVIGPGPENSRDLFEFNYEITGKKPHKEYVERIERIAKEFFPLFEKIFSKKQVSYEEINNEMAFPTAEEFAEYYWSTLLWRESIEGRSQADIDRLKKETVKAMSSQIPVTVKKQVSCLVGKEG